MNNIYLDSIYLGQRFWFYCIPTLLHVSVLTYWDESEVEVPLTFRILFNSLRHHHTQGGLCILSANSKTKSLCSFMVSRISKYEVILGRCGKTEREAAPNGASISKLLAVAPLSQQTWTIE